MLGHRSLFRHCQIFVITAEIPAISILAQQSHRSHQGILHGLIIRIHNRRIQACGQTHGKEVTVNQRTIWHTKGNITQAHSSRIAITLAVKPQSLQRMVASICICSNGHNQTVQQEIAILQPSIFCSANNDIHNLQPLLSSLWNALVCQRQAQNGCTIFTSQRNKFFQPFHLSADRIYQGTARISPQACLQGYRIAGINGQRSICQLSNFRNRPLHSSCLINTAYTHIYIQKPCTSLNLVQCFSLYRHKGTILDFGCQLFSACRINALTYQNSREFLIHHHGFTATGQH